MTAWGWQERAGCRGESLEVFFGPPGEGRAERQTREEQAIKVCARCPVREACLDYATSRPEKAGVWGGMGEEPRAGERRRRQRRALKAAS